MTGYWTLVIIVSIFGPARSGHVLLLEPVGVLVPSIVSQPLEEEWEARKRNLIDEINLEDVLGGYAEPGPVPDTPLAYVNEAPIGDYLEYDYPTQIPAPSIFLQPDIEAEVPVTAAGIEQQETEHQSFVKRGQLEVPYPPPPRPMKVVALPAAKREGEKEKGSEDAAESEVDTGDIIFVAVVFGCAASAMFGLVAAGIWWRRVHNQYKAAEPIEYGGEIGQNGHSAFACSAAPTFFDRLNNKCRSWTTRTTSDGPPVFLGDGKHVKGHRHKSKCAHCARMKAKEQYYQQLQQEQQLVLLQQEGLLRQQREQYRRQQLQQQLQQQEQPQLHQKEQQQPRQQGQQQTRSASKKEKRKRHSERKRTGVHQLWTKLHEHPTRSKSQIDVSQCSLDSDDVNNDDNSVYECPGLAPTTNVEVTNPLFKSNSLDEDLASTTKLSIPLPDRRTSAPSHIIGHEIESLNR